MSVLLMSLIELSVGMLARDCWGMVAEDISVTAIVLETFIPSRGCLLCIFFVTLVSVAVGFVAIDT